MFSPFVAAESPFEAWHAERDLGIDVERLQRELQRDGKAPEALTNKAVETVLAAARTAKREATEAKGRSSVPLAVARFSRLVRRRHGIDVNIRVGRGRDGNQHPLLREDAEIYHYVAEWKQRQSMAAGIVQIAQQTAQLQRLLI